MIPFLIMSLLSNLNDFTIGTDEHYSKCYNANDAKGFQILYSDTQNQVNLVLLIAASD